MEPESLQSKGVGGCDPGARVAVACLDAAARPRAERLAAHLGLRCLNTVPGEWRAICDFSFVLLVDVLRVALGMTGSPRINPVAVDFSEPALLARAREAGARRQDLARAIGVHERRDLRIVDATAGWGRDSGVLAALGCRVVMVERHPLVAALLRDGLERAQCSDADAVRSLAARLELYCDDACEFLDGWQGEPPDSILIDPMFPEKTKSAAVRKEMRFFQDIVGSDDDAAALLQTALTHAKHRVVVKRPRHAAALAGPPPTLTITGRSTRFDIYVLRSLKNR